MDAGSPKENSPEVLGDASPSPEAGAEGGMTVLEAVQVVEEVVEEFVEEAVVEEQASPMDVEGGEAVGEAPAPAAVAGGEAGGEAPPAVAGGEPGAEAPAAVVGGEVANEAAAAAEAATTAAAAAAAAAVAAVSEEVAAEGEAVGEQEPKEKGQEQELEETPGTEEDLEDFGEEEDVEPEPAQTLKRSLLEILRQANVDSEAVDSFYRPLEMDLGDLAPESSLPGAAAEAPPAEEKEGEFHKCRPLSLRDYYARLETFKPGRWFAKPMAINPIQCVRRGWKGTGRDTIECVCCGEELTITRQGDIWIINDKPFDAPPGLETLVNAHSHFCPWRCHDVSLTDPAEMSNRMILEATEYRLAKLRAKLRHVPVLAAPNEENASDPEQLPNIYGASDEDPCECLARAGWEIDDRYHLSSSSSSGGQSSSPDAGGLDIIRCFFCLRSVAIQSFPHRPTETREQASTERPAKRRKRVATPSELPPQAGLWTPKSGGKTDPTEPVKMDPHSLHRYYCPMYSSIDEDLSPLAKRLIEVRIKALNGLLPELDGAATNAETKQPGAEAEDGANTEEERQKRITQAMAKAEELLESLQVILPVE